MSKNNKVINKVVVKNELKVKSSETIDIIFNFLYSLLMHDKKLGPHLSIIPLYPWRITTCDRLSFSRMEVIA